MCNASNRFDNLQLILHSQMKKRVVFTSDDESAKTLYRVCRIFKPCCIFLSLIQLLTFNPVAWVQRPSDNHAVILVLQQCLYYIHFDQ